MVVQRERGYLGEAFVVVHHPTAPARAAGVLLLPPLGYEDTSAYRPLRVLVDALAEAGHLAVRLDWPGLGDSGGEDLDPDLHERRLQAVRRATDALRAAGATQVIGLAVRAGGLLALAAGGLDQLVAWGLPASGRRYLREEKAFHRLAAKGFGAAGEAKRSSAETGESPGPRWRGPGTYGFGKGEGEPLPEGSQEAGGFLHGPAVVAALKQIDAAELAREAGLSRALLIGRDGAAPEPELVHALGAETVEGEGLGDLLENAYHAALLPRIREAILAWMPADPGEVGPLPLDPELLLPHGQERPWLLEVDGRLLSGILCEPEEGLRPGQDWQVFFNAGGIRRSGPNRLWTRIARELAARGRPSLRFDVHDVGDSDGTAEPWEDLEQMYAEDSVGDALAAVDWIAGRGPAAIDVAGLCSGAFFGAQVSARRSVRRAVLFNGLAWVWDEEARASSMTAHIRPSLFDARRWRRLLGGRIDARALAAAILRKGRLRLTDLLDPDHAPDPVAALFAEIRARGTDLQLVSSEGDPSIGYLEAHVSPDERPPLTLIPGADHTIRPVQLHRRVVDLVLG